MTGKPENIWNRPWKGFRGVLWWFILLTAAVFVVSFCIGLRSGFGRLPDLLGSSLAFAVIFSLFGIVIVGPVRWLCRWRNLMRALFAAACLVTLIALFLTEENVRGKRAWKQFVRGIEAKGEKFTLASLAPPPVPDEKNFALTPLLKPIYDYEHTTNGVQWRDTNGYARLQAFRADRLGPGKLVLGDLEKGTFTDLEACRRYYRANTNYPQPAVPGTAAEDILTAMQPFEPGLKELRDAAVARPLCRFPLEYQFEPPYAVLLPHLAHLKGIATLLELHAIARLESRQADDAFQDLKLAFRISDCISNEPILIDHLVRLAMLKSDLQTVREGLVRHAWSDAQLAELERYLASLNLLAEYQLTMRGERAFGTGSLDYVRRRGWHENPFDLLNDTSPAPSPILVRFLNPLVGGFYYQNMLTIAEAHERFTLPAVDDKAHRIFPELSEEMDREIRAAHQKPYLHPYRIFSALLLPALSRATARSGQTQTFVDEARVACALERFRLANGGLPEKLEALVPQFIDAIPNDVIDGRPLRYHRTAGDGYLVYSIGWNRRDDNGEVAQKDSFAASPEGDWVWSLPGK